MKYFFTFRQLQAVFFIVICFVATFSFRYVSRVCSAQRGNPTQMILPFTVEITGEVNLPGIYSFEHVVTVKDVVKRAGGLKKNVFLSPSFYARILPNGSHLVIAGNLSNITVGIMEPRKRFLYRVPFNINTAGVGELVIIPGIGETTAGAIVQYRMKNGPFNGPETLREVPGIGRATLETMRDYLVY